jgi:pilus assembly protein Flp/PilA
MSKTKRNKKESGQGLVEYALILVLVAIVVIAVLMLLGPIIGNVFSTINSSLSGATSGSGGAVAAPGIGCSDIHADGYATGAGYGWDCYSPTAGAYNIP